MQKNRAAYSLAVGGFLALLTAGLLFLVAQDRIDTRSQSGIGDLLQG